MAFRYIKYHFIDPNGNLYFDVEVCHPNQTDAEIKAELRDELEMWATEHKPIGENLEEFLQKCTLDWTVISRAEYRRLDALLSL